MAGSSCIGGTGRFLSRNIYLIVKRFLNFERIEQILNEVKERSIIEICHRIKKSSDAQYVAVRSTDW